MISDSRTSVEADAIGVSESGVPAFVALTFNIALKFSHVRRARYSLKVLTEFPSICLTSIDRSARMVAPQSQSAMPCSCQGRNEITPYPEGFMNPRRFVNRQLKSWIGTPCETRNHRRVRLSCERLESRDAPAILTVTNLADAGAGSLRQAILDANVDGGTDTIVFSGAATGGTISLLTRGGTTFGPNALEVTSTIIIQGSGETIQRDNAAPNMRLFFVATGGDLTLNDVTLTNGFARGGDGGTNLGDDGGGGGGGFGGRRRHLQPRLADRQPLHADGQHSARWNRRRGRE
jgi:hypothetical protein